MKPNQAGNLTFGVSDDEESDSGLTPSQTPLEKRKKQIVDNVMAIVMQWLDTTFPPKQNSHGDRSFPRKCNASEEGGRSARRERDGDNDKENQAPRRPRKRQQRDETPDGDGNGEDDDEREGKGNKRAKKDPEDTHRKFACPFYKHDQSKYKNSRACRFPGFSTMHRLK